MAPFPPRGLGALWVWACPLCPPAPMSSGSMWPLRGPQLHPLVGSRHWLCCSPHSSAAKSPSLVSPRGSDHLASSRAGFCPVPWLPNQPPDCASPLPLHAAPPLEPSVPPPYPPVTSPDSAASQRTRVHFFSNLCSPWPAHPRLEQWPGPKISSFRTGVLRRLQPGSSCLLPEAFPPPQPDSSPSSCRDRCSWVPTMWGGVRPPTCHLTRSFWADAVPASRHTLGARCLSTEPPSTVPTDPSTRMLRIRCVLSGRGGSLNINVHEGFAQIFL